MDIVRRSFETTTDESLTEGLAVVTDWNLVCFLFHKCILDKVNS